MWRRLLRSERWKDGLPQFDEESDKKDNYDQTYHAQYWVDDHFWNKTKKQNTSLAVAYKLEIIFKHSSYVFIDCT